jgi:hypothetical protein
MTLKAKSFACRVFTSQDNTTERDRKYLPVHVQVIIRASKEDGLGKEHSKHEGGSNLHRVTRHKAGRYRAQSTESRGTKSSC